MIQYCTNGLQYVKVVTIEQYSTVRMVYSRAVEYCTDGLQYDRVVTVVQYSLV